MTSLYPRCFTAALMVGASCLLSSTAMAADNPKLLAVKIAAAPKLDGKADESHWKSGQPVQIVAKGVMPKTRGTSSDVTVCAAYSDTHLYLLVQWTDATKSDAGHRTWVWDPEKNAYSEGTDREDALSVAFEHTGPFTANMLSGEDATWDVWHWKAFRTNPQGYAMDRSHRYSRTQPSGKANKHPAKTGGDVWIARPEDAGDTVEKQQNAPKENKGPKVLRYLPGTPTGSAADVRAKGTWADGKWRLELARKLDTGHPDDTRFDPTRTYKFAVGVHNDTGDMDKATGVIELGFAK